MPRNRHQRKPSKSPFPVSEPESTRSPLSSSKEDILSNIELLLQKGKLEEALEKLDAVPNRIKRSPEFMLLHATTLLEYGDFEEGGRMLRELERKNPKYAPLYLPLGSWYLMYNWPSHAYRAANKVLSASKYDDEAYEMAQSLSEAAKGMIQFLASTYALPFDKAEQASWYNEQAQLALRDDNLREVEHLTQEALKVMPAWTPPRNNLAYALYFSGKCKQAIVEAETVVRNDPDNTHGLNNLLMFHAGVGQEEKAFEYARKLFELSSGFEKDAEEVNIIISGLAIVEDTDALWKLAQRYLRKREDTLLFSSWYCLGVAAARLGHFKEAKKFFERSLGEESDAVDSPMEKVEAALKSGRKKLLWPPMYPGLVFLFPARQMKEWAEITGKIDADELTAGQQRKINAFLEKYPFVFQAFKRLLWVEDASELGASALVMVNKPEGDAEILRFAFSDTGDNSSRMRAIMMLVNAGRYTPGESVEFWDADKGKWNEVQLFSQRIEEVEYNIKPQTADLINKSRLVEDPHEAISLLRQAVKDDPTCAMALHNLGVVLIQNGETEEGELLLKRSVEVDPTYTFGFANLGLIEAQNGNKELALEYLMKINQAKVIAPNTSAIANLAYMVLAIQDKDIERARRHFDMAQEIDPDNRLLDHFEERLNLLESFDGMSTFLQDYQKQSANRFHKKALNTPLTEQADLKDCLSKQTNETLSAICRFWRTKVYGKKKEMVARLTARILDVEISDEIFKALEGPERDALKWLLDGGGWRPWSEFTRKFGDDMDESPYWHYHDPESIPGRLKWAGLLFVGKIDNQEVAFIPTDLRVLLEKVL